MVFLITYDLNKPGQNYNKLYDEIKKAARWWHYLDSTWIIETQISADIWQERLKKHVIDDDDYLLVIQVCDNYQGWLPEKAWEWLRKLNFNC